MTAHAQKPDVVLQRNGRVHLNRRVGGSVQSTAGSRGVASADSNCIDSAPSSSARLLATHSIHIFLLLLYPWELENGSVVDRAFVLMKDPSDT